VINAARGRHLVSADLLEALDSGQVAGAFLDVTEPEPLPVDHPFWTHPRIALTPHVAGVTNPYTAAEQVAENIRRVRAGEPLINEVDVRSGY
jgi:glyoxylate/hydroxypyruvate reductase A